MNEPLDIKTLTLVEDFVSAAEEQELLEILEANIPSGTTRHHKQLRRNVVQRWGSNKPYFNDVLSPIIPDYFQPLLDRLVAQKLVGLRPDSVTLNQYLKNQAISAHIDDPKAGNVITVLSLKSPATMVFRRDAQSVSVDLPARSLVQMRDDIRYNWTHEILPVAVTRYSLVFRCSLESQ